MTNESENRNAHASPSEEYLRRLNAREVRVAEFERIHVRLGNLRLLLVAAAAITGWESISREAFSARWLLLPMGAFVFVGLYHSKLLRRKSQAERAATVYRDGLARIEDRWAGNGQGGGRFDAPHHLYAADLDLFGKGSLFELLSRARTRMGEETLSQWLSSPATVETIRERHQAVAELRDRLDFREELAVLGEDPRVGVRPQPLLEWAGASTELKRAWMRWLAPVLAFFALAFAVVWWERGIGTPFFLVVAIEGIITFSLRNQLARTLESTEQAFENLDLLSALLKRLEGEPFVTPPLKRLLQELTSLNLAGSQAMARLRTIVQFIESRRNPIFRLLDVPLLYSVQVALAGEAWRRSHGRAVGSWLRVAGEIEALVSIAAYSYEHPADPFPEFSEGSVSFVADELGHPLIATEKCVRNSVNLSGDTRVLLVSGSNMSGKSTLLRSVGINAVLAMAGAPVRARRLQLTPVQIGASIRVNDSLHEGSSRFYAEITRLRQICDRAAQQPRVLFLLDELLQGTNSNDRKIGAEGIVRALVELGAIGLISTHDLALTDIRGLVQGSLRNVHFQDELENGRMKFDFTLHDGVVTKSNGLELMRAIGLKI